MDIILVCCYRPGFLRRREHRLADWLGINPRDLGGESILTVGDGYNPLLLDGLHKIYEDRGIEVSSSPQQSYQATVRHAQLLRLPVITVDLPDQYHEAPIDMVLRPIVDEPVEVEFKLMRHQSNCRSTSDKVWMIARELASNGAALGGGRAAT